ncbi:MAG: hypothetical protein B6I38_08210 [Anaerolineaceae bacterium 4572_5.1]|nr:MAG: hypothetical protein B6I38_08210 [Anaerolineaceae bacterium 4572_5.1]
MAKMFFGATPSSAIKCAMRRVSARVFPAPGPATMMSGASVVLTAACCSGLRVSGSGFLVSCFRFLVSGFLFLVFEPET